MFFWVIFLITVFAGFAMTVREGIWSNTILLMNIFFSGLVAFGFYSGIVVWLDEDVTSGQHTYWLDFAILWALFLSTMVITRSLTGACSKTRMRFKHPLDPVLGPVIGLFSGWVLATFVLATLHVSPMPKDAFNGRLQWGSTDPSSITQPDVAWLRFAESMSDKNAFGGPNTDEFKYSTYYVEAAKHREKFEKSTSFIVKRGP